jgi:drug/metabolite transporter (DMT)-like permease
VPARPTPEAAAGLGFVALWGTGFVGAKYGLPWAGPFDFLAIRFAIVTGLIGLVAVVWRAPWPRDARSWLHIAVAGLLLHGVYLGGVFAGIDAGVPAGISALIVGIQPVLTAFAVGPLLGERLARRQWVGFVLGFLGLLLVLGERVSVPDSEGMAALACPLIALLGITVGTLYQKRFCPHLDLRSGTTIQYAAAAAAMIPIALVFDDQPLQWTGEFIFALGWLSIVLSLGAISLLFFLLRRGQASRVTSLFYLVPPTAAGYAWLLFGETLGPMALVGMAVIMMGLALVNRSARVS